MYYENKDYLYRQGVWIDNRLGYYLDFGNGLRTNMAVSGSGVTLVFWFYYAPFLPEASRGRTAFWSTSGYSVKNIGINADNTFQYWGGVSITAVSFLKGTQKIKENAWNCLVINGSFAFLNGVFDLGGLNYSNGVGVVDNYYYFGRSMAQNGDVTLQPFVGALSYFAIGGASSQAFKDQEKLANKLWNGGKGLGIKSLLRPAAGTGPGPGFLGNYSGTGGANTLEYDFSQAKYNGGFYGEFKRNGENLPALLPGLPYWAYQGSAYVAEQAGQVFKAPFAPMPAPEPELKKYIYPKSSPVLRGGNFTGAIVQYDGVTDLPESWDYGYADFSGNKLGGTANAADVAVTNVTRSYLKDVFAEYQAPVGKHQIAWKQSVDMITFNFHASRVSKCVFTTDAASIIINVLQLGYNLLTQTFAELLDATKIRTKVLQFHQNPGVTGAFAFSDIQTEFWATNCALSGTIPELPATLLVLYLSSNSITVHPLNYGNANFVELLSNQLNGTATLVNSYDFRMGDGNFSTIANYQGTTGAGNIIDASANARNMQALYCNSCRTIGVNLPTTPGRTIQYFSCSHNVGLTALAFPSWLMFPNTGSFVARLCSLNITFPLGAVIASTNIYIDGNGINEDNINATFDSWIDNQSNFQGAGTVKTLYAGGTNAAPSTVGRATRLDEIVQVVETYNWLLVTNLPTAKQYLKILSFTNLVADQIIININASEPTATWAPGNTLTISNTLNINGSWTLVSKGNDAAATNGNNGTYYKLSKAGFGTGTATETGVITK